LKTTKLFRENKENRNTWRDFGILNVVEMYILPKVINIVNIIPIKTPIKLL
jgi:hypothetical protein